MSTPESFLYAVLCDAAEGDRTTGRTVTLRAVAPRLNTDARNPEVVARMALAEALVTHLNDARQSSTETAA